MNLSDVFNPQSWWKPEVNLNIQGQGVELSGLNIPEFNIRKNLAEYLTQGLTWGFNRITGGMADDAYKAARESGQTDPVVKDAVAHIAFSAMLTEKVGATIAGFIMGTREALQQFGKTRTVASSRQDDESNEIGKAIGRWMKENPEFVKEHGGARAVAAMFAKQVAEETMGAPKTGWKENGQGLIVHGQDITLAPGLTVSALALEASKVPHLKPSGSNADRSPAVIEQKPVAPIHASTAPVC